MEEYPMKTMARFLPIVVCFSTIHVTLAADVPHLKYADPEIVGVIQRAVVPQKLRPRDSARTYVIWGGCSLTSGLRIPLNREDPNPGSLWPDWMDCVANRCQSHLFDAARSVYCLYWIKALVLRQIASDCFRLHRIA